MLTKDEVQHLFNTRKSVIKKDAALDKLWEYVAFLDDIGGHSKQVEYIQNELMPIMIIECIFGSKIYDYQDLEDFYKYHKRTIEKETRKFLLQSRSNIRINESMMKKLWEIFDISMVIVKTRQFETWDVLHSWINDAVRDIEGAEDSYDTGDFPEALKRLELGVEKLIKTYAIYIGLKQESELFQLKHSVSDVYVDLLKESWTTKVKDTLGLKDDIKKHIQTLEKHRKNMDIKKPTKQNIDRFKNQLFEWDKSTEFFLKTYNKINKKLQKKFKEKSIRYLVRFCNVKVKTDVEAYYRAWFGFSGLLLPLAFITYFYQSKFSYPDYRRPLDVNYENLVIINNFKSVTRLLLKNIKLLRDSFNEKQNFAYALLCETMNFNLDRINYYSRDNTNLKTINNSLNRIKSNEYINQLIEKLSDNDIIEDIEDVLSRKEDIDLF